MTTPEVGTVLRSRYVLQDKLGKNATRQTWLAEDRENQRSVVVKMLAFNLQLQWQEVKLFEREAQALQRLEHPRIPKYLDYFTVEGQPSWMTLVQSYVPGESLQAQLERGDTFDEERLRQIATDVLTVLSYLHDRQPPVLHRDIKPSNLIAGESGQTYLVDFGAAQIQPAQMGTFTVVGTYGYTPMEQFGGRAVPASDLYSLGATLVHLATGIPPADLPQKDFRIDYRDRVRLSPEFMDCLDRLIEPGLGDRYTSGHQAMQGIEYGPAAPIPSEFCDDPISPDSATHKPESSKSTTLSSWENPSSLGTTSRIKYKRTRLNIVIKFKVISFSDYLKSKAEKRKPITWQRKYVNYMSIWIGIVFVVAISAVLQSNIPFWLILILPAMIYGFLVSWQASDYERHAEEITLTLDNRNFSVAVSDPKSSKNLLLEEVQDLSRLELFGSQREVENEALFDLIQIEVVKLDSSRRSLQLDTSLHPAELGWIQKNLNRDIQRFHQSQAEQVGSFPYQSSNR